MKFYLFSLGCKVNSYETLALGAYLNKEGYEETFSISKADLIIVNTCAVTSKAEQKSRQHIRSLKSKNPKAKVFVMGCQSELHLKENRLLGADAITGVSTRLATLKELLSSKDNVQVGPSQRCDFRHQAYEELGDAASLGQNARIYLKIQDGCDNFCSYCYIPFIRGNSRSRSPEAIIEEAKHWVSLGYKEIILSGIHIGGYGKDFKDRNYVLTDLMEDILSSCPPLYSLRISSIEESEIDDKFLSLLGKYSNIADHLHIPLQSGSEDVLKRMKRKYGVSTFLDKLSRIREIRPNIAITTDVIVGFPKETEEEFKETLAFCKKAEFAEIHVFPFSSRPLTYASTLPDLPSQVKKERVGRLLNLSKELRLSYEKRFYGKDLSVLFEEYDDEKKLAIGHSSNYLKVSVPSPKKMDGEVETVVYDVAVASD